MDSLKNKVVVITGASSGIGAALAREMARERANLVLAARNEDKLKALAQDIENEGGQVIWVKTDVTHEADCEQLMQIAIEKFGRIDVLINNAGISMRALFQDLDIEVLKRVMEVNFWGTVYCTKYALNSILENKGSVVGISSIAGYRGLPARTGYSASKFAMHGFLESLRCETIKSGINVLTVCPGYTASNIRHTALTKDGNEQGATPLDESKLMSAEAVATQTIRAIKKRKRTLTMTFEGKLAVFLNKWFPSLMDKIIYNKVAKEPGSPFK